MYLKYKAQCTTGGRHTQPLEEVVSDDGEGVIRG